MDVVVSHIPCDQQTGRGDMQTRRVVSVCMTDFDHDKLMPFELDYISRDFLGDHQTFRNLAGIARVPETRKRTLARPAAAWIPPHRALPSLSLGGIDSGVFLCQNN